MTPAPSPSSVPPQRPTPQRSPEPEEPAADATPSPRRVLVAEDDSLIRMDLTEMLREEGYDVVGEAPNGQVAVDLTESLSPDW